MLEALSVELEKEWIFATSTRKFLVKHHSKRNVHDLLTWIEVLLLFKKRRVAYHYVDCMIKTYNCCQFLLAELQNIVLSWHLNNLNLMSELIYLYKPAGINHWLWIRLSSNKIPAESSPSQKRVNESSASAYIEYIFDLQWSEFTDPHKVIEPVRNSWT